MWAAEQHHHMLHPTQTEPLNRCPALSRISLTLDYIFLSLFILALDHLSFGRYAIF